MPALAQTTEGPIQEVLVTAQRTPSLASKTPVAMTVLSGAALERSGIDSPAALGARSPNVELDGAADGLKITIRGVTNADTTEKGDPSAAFMLDGIYIARPQSQNLAFYDIDRVEILRGPQGTLYGRNTTAGAINVISNAPSARLEAAAGLEVGSYASRKASAMFNVPLSQALAVRAAFAANRHDSYLDNHQGTSHHLGLDRDDASARLSARLALGQDAALLLRVDHSTVNDNNDSIVPDTNFYRDVASGNPSWYDASTAARLANGFVPPNGAPAQGFSHKDTTGVTAELNWKIGSATLSYLGGHRSFEHDFLVNYYYRVAPGFALGVREGYGGSFAQNSHELRLATAGGGALTAQAGLYYFKETSHAVASFRDLELLGLPPYYVFPHGPTSSRSQALFGQATWRVTQALRLTAGARFTDDAKERVGSTNFQQGPAFNPATDLALLNAAWPAPAPWASTARQPWPSPPPPWCTSPKR
ncbi:MAG: TonB-dependent receptor [Pseudomonadota bacterium]